MKDLQVDAASMIAQHCLDLSEISSNQDSHKENTTKFETFEMRASRVAERSGFDQLKQSCIEKNDDFSAHT